MSKRDKAHPKVVQLEQCVHCGAYAIHPTIKACLKCGERNNP